MKSFSKELLGRRKMDVLSLAQEDQGVNETKPTYFSKTKGIPYFFKSSIS